MIILLDENLLSKKLKQPFLNKGYIIHNVNDMGWRGFKDKEIIDLAEKHNSLYGNNFTYTLVDERAYNRMLKRRGLYVAITIGIGVAGYFIYKKYFKK